MARGRGLSEDIKHLTPEINTARRLRLEMGDLKDGISFGRLLENSKPDIVFHWLRKAIPKQILTRRCIREIVICETDCLSRSRDDRAGNPCWKFKEPSYSG